ncbi:hypothetical protein E2562_003748, partial [Oryza meyeriana var. granulata]
KEQAIKPYRAFGIWHDGTIKQKGKQLTSLTNKAGEALLTLLGSPTRLVCFEDSLRF